MSDRPQRNSGDSGGGVAGPQSHTSRRASLRSPDARDVSRERPVRGSIGPGDTNGKQRGRDTVPTSASPRTNSHGSKVLTKSPLSDQMKESPLSASNGKQEKSRSSRRHSHEQGKPVAQEELLHLLRPKGTLSNIRPDMYRLDLTQKDDLRFLYETQHRVDPELVPITRRLTPRWKQKNESHIFDAPSTPPERRKPSTSVKKNDGLGSIARFLLEADAKTKTPARGRGHRNCNSGRSALCLFGGDYSNEVENNINTPRPESRRKGGRLAVHHPSDHLGRDLLVREPLCEDIVPRHGIRTIKAVQAFEAGQPKLTLPPKKQSNRFTNAMQGHSAGKDNDVFGVRERRENMMRRARSASVSSKDPRSIVEEDIVLRRRRSGRRSEASSEYSTERRSNTPFGDEEGGSRVSRTRGRQSSSQRSSLRDTSTCSVASSPSVKYSKRPQSSRRSVSSRGSQRRNDDTKSHVSTSYETSSCTGSAMWEDDGQRINSKFMINRPSNDLLISPRTRTGRARVPGRSNAVSHIIIGGENAIVSPRLTQQKAQLKSDQMRGILSWA